MIVYAKTILSATFNIPYTIHLHLKQWMIVNFKKSYRSAGDNVPLISIDQLHYFIIQIVGQVW